MVNDYFKQFNSGEGVAFMDGRERGLLAGMVGKTVHIEDFAFLHGEDGDYAVFIVAENPTTFYFGNSIVTDILKKVEADGMKEALVSQPVLVDQKTSKRGRTYTAIRFVD